MSQQSTEAFLEKQMVGSYTTQHFPSGQWIFGDEDGRFAMGDVIGLGYRS